MSVDATRWAWSVDVSSATKRLVLLSLADRAGEDNTCFPSAKRMTLDTKLDRKTILNAITDLIDDGFVLDTGERKGTGVRVLKLVGVNGRENEIYPKRLSDTKIGTGTKNGISSSTEIGIPSDTKIGIQNLKWNLKENLKERPVKKSVMGEALKVKNANPELIKEWVEVRTKLKATDSERAVSMFFKQVEKSGLSLNTVLNICVIKKWKGFEASYVLGKDYSDYIFEDQKIEQKPVVAKPVVKAIRKNYLD